MTDTVDKVAPKRVTFYREGASKSLQYFVVLRQLDNLKGFSRAVEGGTKQRGGGGLAVCCLEVFCGQHGFNLKTEIRKRQI